MRPIHLLIVMSFLAMPWQAARADQSQADSAAPLPKLKVVTCVEPPYQMQETGQPLTGVSVELVQMMLKEAGVSPAIEVLPWSRAYKMAQQEQNVMLFTILRNPPRERLFKWVGALHPFEVYFYRLKDRPEIVVDALDDARKYRIGVVRDDSRNIYLRTQKFSENLEEVNLDEQAIKMLFLRRIDLLPSDPIVLSYWFKVMNEEPRSTHRYDIGKVEKILHVAGADGENYIAMSPQTDDRVVEHFRRALDRVKASPRYRQLLDKYMK